MKRLLITEAQLINEGRCYIADLLVAQGRIARIDKQISDPEAIIISGKGKYLLPGLIDTHVHFREPGYPQKGNMASESRAAVAGGVTSFLDMPNTFPPTISYELLEEKYRRAAGSSVANYGFYIGATEDNTEELLRVPAGAACAVKVFMGSSTGNMLVEDEAALARIFSEVPMLIAVHCEEESIITRQKAAYQDREAELHAANHPYLRPREACLASTQKALKLAQQYGTQLHVLHISTAEELDLFSATHISDKQITAEGCLHHLSFCDKDYAIQGNRIKVNPAIKTEADQAALWEALRANKLDILGSDHAPHTWEEKQQRYWNAPSGAPMVQQSLYTLLEAQRKGNISLAQIVEKFCHHPALRFGIQERGFLREGYHADLVLVEACAPWVLGTAELLHHCKWSPLEGKTFRHSVNEVIVSGKRVYSAGHFLSSVPCGERLIFTTVRK